MSAPAFPSSWPDLTMLSTERVPDVLDFMISQQRKRDSFLCSVLLPLMFEDYLQNFCNEVLQHDIFSFKGSPKMNTAVLEWAAFGLSIDRSSEFTVNLVNKLLDTFESDDPQAPKLLITKRGRESLEDIYNEWGSLQYPSEFQDIQALRLATHIHNITGRIAGDQYPVRHYFQQLMGEDNRENLERMTEKFEKNILPPLNERQAHYLIDNLHLIREEIQAEHLEEHFKRMVYTCAARYPRLLPFIKSLFDIQDDDGGCEKRRAMPPRTPVGLHA
jgi:hypothetical protein